MEPWGTSKILLRKAAPHRLKIIQLEILTQWKSLTLYDQIVHWLFENRKLFTERGLLRKTSYAVGICFLNRTTTNNITNTTGTNLLLSVCSNASCRYPTLYIISLSRLSVRLSLFVLIKLPLFKVDKWLLLLSILSDNYGKFWHWTLLLTLSFHETPSIICTTSLCMHFSPKLKVLFTLLGLTAVLTHKQQWTIWSQGFGRAWIYTHSSVYDTYVELPFLSLILLLHSIYPRTKVHILGFKYHDKWNKG